MNVLEDYGLIVVDRPQVRCPLESVDVRTTLDEQMCAVDITQTFVNSNEEVIEAVYKFPLPHDAKVTGFTAKFGDSVVYGEFVEQKKAVLMYEDAKKQGHQAVLVDGIRKDLFEIAVGNIDPQQTVVITLSYMQDLTVIDDEIRWTLPTVVAKRYMPQDSSAVENKSELNIEYGDTKYSLTFHATWTTVGGIHSIESPSHKIDASETAGAWQIKLSDSNVKLDRDFILKAKLREAEEFYYEACELSNQSAIARVKFTIDSSLNRKAEPADYVFMIDISGSMHGSNIIQAKQALQLAIRNLDEGDTFNIIAFESNFKSFAQEPQTYNQTSLDNATRWIKSLDTTGGTEIFTPVEYVLTKYPRRGEFERIVLLFTDGQVWNENQVINLIEKNNHHLRFYSFGIDTAVNRQFIDGIAAAGNGMSEYVYPGEQIDDKILRQFARIHAEYVSDVQVVTDLGKQLTVFPDLPRRLYVDEQHHFILEATDLEHFRSVRITGTKTDGVQWSFELGEPNSANSRLLGLRWAKSQIENLEKQLDDSEISEKHKRALKKTIIELSQEHGVGSTLTSMVAVLERDNKKVTKSVRLQVPMQTPYRDDDVHYSEIMLAAAPSMKSFSLIGGLFSKINDYSVLKESMVDQVFSDISEPDHTEYADVDSPRFTKSEVSKSSAPKADNTLKAIAVQQNADGSFGAGALRWKQTALFIISFLQFPEKEWRLYRRQLEKAGNFLLEQGRLKSGFNVWMIAGIIRLVSAKIMGEEVSGELEPAKKSLDASDKKIVESVEKKDAYALLQLMGVTVVNVEDVPVLLLNQVSKVRN